MEQIPQSRYHFESTLTGFVITSEGRLPVLITLIPEKTAIAVVQSTSGSIPAAWREEGSHVRLFNPFAFSTLLKHVSRTLLSTWEPRHTPAYYHIQEWAVGKLEKALKYRFYGEWQRLVQLIPEPKHAVLRAVFAANFPQLNTGGDGIECWEELYSGDYPHFLSDIVQLRSAAVVCHHYRKFLFEAERFARWVEGQESNPQAALHAGIQTLASLRYRAFAVDPGYSGSPSPEMVAEKRRRLLQVLDQDWRILFATRRDGFVSRPVRQILAHWPGGVPASLLFPLWQRPPERRICSRLEYLVYAFYVQNDLFYARHFKIEAPQTLTTWYHRLFLWATREEIVRAVQRFTRFVHADCNTRAATIAELIRFLLDYCWAQPEDARAKGNLAGLVTRSIIWHREVAERENQLPEEERLQRVALPPIALPDRPSVTFLATQGELVDEGVRMLHCVGTKTYRTLALDGGSFFFHVSYRGEEATIQVDRYGRVVQAHGPHNRANKAAFWGKRWLNAWGRAFPQPEPRADMPWSVWPAARR
jgi:hypothetical protein